MLDREEYIEQAYLFRSFAERITAGIAAQEALVAIGQEVLATSKLPMALDYLAGRTCTPIPAGQRGQAAGGTRPRALLTPDKPTTVQREVPGAF